MLCLGIFHKIIKPAFNALINTRGYELHMDKVEMPDSISAPAALKSQCEARACLMQSNTHCADFV